MRKSLYHTQPAGPLKKLLTLVAGLALLVLGLMFSVVVLIAAVVIGLMVWAYLWWKTRELRRVMREAQTTARPSATDGDIIEGEAVVVEEPGTADRPMLPAQSRDASIRRPAYPPTPHSGDPESGA